MIGLPCRNTLFTKQPRQLWDINFCLNREPVSSCCGLNMNLIFHIRFLSQANDKIVRAA